MPLLEDLLRTYKPENWADFNYRSESNGKRYILVDVANSSSEFKTVSDDFTSSNVRRSVTKIERVQHPYAYLSFEINCKYKNVHPTQQSVTYLPAPPNLEQFLNYNCDRRIAGHSLYDGRVYIQIKTMYSRDSSGAHWYPMYLIHTQQHSSNNSLELMLPTLSLN